MGCGTLILIALIVLIFSNAEQQQLRELRSDVQALTEEVRAMRQVIDGENVTAPAGENVD